MKKFFASAFLVLSAGVVAAQNAPRIGYVYPAGGKVGTTFTTVIGGQYFYSASNFTVLTDDNCVSAKIVRYDRPLNFKEQQALKETLSKFQEKRMNGERFTSAEIAEATEIKQKLTQFGRRPANPALGEFMTVQFTVATNAAPGDHEVRVRTPFGISNPLKFCIGTLPEVAKADWKALPKERGNTIPTIPTPADTAVTLPAVLNGQIPPGGADRYHFHATQGQHLVVAVAARDLIPYLADAVPGWFQAALTISDSAGKTLAYDDNFRFRPDPVLHCEIPRDSDYTIEIRDSLYRGREDFVYRITVGELPFVTGVFPLGGKAGTRTALTLQGWNLPETNLVEDATAKKPGVYPVTVRKGDWISNPMPFAVDDLPEETEQEPNNTRDKAQPVTLPVIINGRVDRPGDWDVFRFTGKAGDKIVAEVTSRRLDSPLDSVLRLTDAAGKQLAYNDDFEDKGTGLETHHADSYLTAMLPADGDYFIHLGDTQHKGGPEYSYRLRLSAPRPDFALRVAPSSVSVRGGTSAPLTVYALRRDGFTNAITLVLADAPKGFKLGGGGIPAGQDQVKVTLSAPPPADTNAPVHVTVEGVSAVDGKPVIREAVPAEDMMQAFAYRHLVPAKEMDVAVLERRALRAPLKITSATALKIPAGGDAKIQLGFLAAKLAEALQFELVNPPEGIFIQNSTETADGIEITLHTDAKIAPGMKDNLIINSFVTRIPATDKAKKNTAKLKVNLGALPAVSLEILPPP